MDVLNVKIFLVFWSVVYVCYYNKIVSCFFFDIYVMMLEYLYIFFIICFNFVFVIKG